MTAADPPCRQPLLITADPDLLDAVLQVAAVAGVDVHVVPDLVAARSVWEAAPLVLVGADTIGALTRTELTSRPALAVVSLSGSTPAMGADPRLARFVLPGDDSLLTAHLDSAGGRPARVVAVVGGRGGAGASTLAAALAVTAAAAGSRTMLVDADPYGGGLDLVLGAEEQDGLRWPDLDALHGPVASAVLVDTLPRAHGVTVLSYGRTGGHVATSAATEVVVEAAVRAHDLVVADLPRHPDLSGDVILRASDLALVVVPAEVRATAAARCVVSRLAGLVPDVRAVVRGPAPSGLDARTVARLLGLPCAGWLRAESRLPVTLDRGEPPGGKGRGPLADLCRRLLAELDVTGERAA